MPNYAPLQIVETADNNLWIVEHGGHWLYKHSKGSWDLENPKLLVDGATWSKGHTFSTPRAAYEAIREWATAEGFQIVGTGSAGGNGGLFVYISNDFMKAEHAADALAEVRQGD